MTEEERTGGTAWICGKCNVSLEVSRVQVAYLGSVFYIDLPKCPECGAVVVIEEVAAGKMAEAEQLLEDK